MPIAWIPSDAIRGRSSPRHGPGSRTRFASKFNCGRLEGRDVSRQARGDGAARELVADDVGCSPTTGSTRGPKKIAGYFDHDLGQGRGTTDEAHRWCSLLQERTTPNGTIASATAYYSGIVPKEVASADAGAGNWKNVNGSRAVPARRFRAGQLQHLRQEPELLDTAKINGRRDEAARWSTR